ncbi:MAG: aminomethyl-transferring glycine dehydrogenase subunit GcvPB [Endomicrobium sp.]|jgi:glycine dehydrogenase subunit 2|nr:aminomethyl-transferring glycine dehydrogenase subunit GcvPB [Endomicrobium sp.]
MRKLLNELSSDCASAYHINSDIKIDNITVPENLIRKSKLQLPTISENELFRYFTNLSRKNYALSTVFYPLGSCTMKYNPLVNEYIAKLEKFTMLHPLQDLITVQGSLEIMYNLEEILCKISGMDAFSLQQAAGAHGEITGLLIIAKYFASIKQKRTKIIIPDSAHGTNSASATYAGFEVISLKSEKNGNISLQKLKNILNSEVAAVMLTVPNTLGIFEKKILEIAELIHENGSLLYYDGANLNAILGVAKPGDMGFDIMHINLHKTFSTPHGGGGPGSGPVGVKKFLEPFLPIPRIIKIKKHEFCFNYFKPNSIGKVKAFFGNFPVILKAYVYIRSLGKEGLKNVSKYAVLNANYLLAKLKHKIKVSCEDKCMHEFVLAPKVILKNGVKTIDIAKRLLDYGYYAPTIYFPTIVEEAIMIEPTETESKQTLDEFSETLLKIIDEIECNPEKVKNSPFNTEVKRLNEVVAARKPILKW